MMKFEFTAQSLDTISVDAVLVFPETESFVIIDKALNGLLTEVVKGENFKGKVGEMLSVHTQKKIPSPKVFIVGLGKKEERSLGELRRALAMFATKTQGKSSSLALSIPSGEQFGKDRQRLTQVMAEGVLLGSYRFNKYKKKEEKKRDFEVCIFGSVGKGDESEPKKGIERAMLFYEATKLTRDLVNEPAALVTPTFLATLALDMAKKNPQLRVTVYDRDQLEKMGMGAFLGVAAAADTPPKFIHLAYTPKRSSTKKKLAIVGKGITFDSGGISIKSGEGMQTMKCDMAGAAVVFSVFSVISKINPPFPVMGLIAATPNLISGKSLVPGDILRAYNGKTIEVLNTDAEGRVTMADSLSFAVKKGATEIIDLATLTGACMVALGNDIAGLFSNNEELKVKVKEAASGAGEKVWELPLEERYKELNKSEIADIANIPSIRYGGAITAALFLDEFIDKIPWVHLDIAGPAFADKAYDFGPKGGTGFGVRTLLEFLSL